MKAMKRPMPSAYRCMELIWDSGDQALANAGEGQSEEDNSGEKHRAECGLPGNSHAVDDGIGKVGVESHTGCQRQRIVRERSHQDAAEGRAKTGGRSNGGQGHAGFAEEGRVHEDDVGHRDEGRQAGKNLGSPVGCVC